MLSIVNPSLGGVNLGLVTVLLNVGLTFGLSYLRPGPEHLLMARWTCGQKDVAERDGPQRVAN